VRVQPGDRILGAYDDADKGENAALSSGVSLPRRYGQIDFTSRP
jgi:hypothetical protein